MQVRQRVISSIILLTVFATCATSHGQRRIQRNTRHYVPKHLQLAQGSGSRVTNPGAVSEVIQNGVQESIQPAPNAGTIISGPPIQGGTLVGESIQGGTVLGDAMGSTVVTQPSHLHSDAGIVIQPPPTSTIIGEGVAAPPFAHSAPMGETIITEGQPILHGGGVDCDSPGCSGCGACGMGIGGGGSYRGLVQQGLSINNLSFFGGIQGFKNQTNRGADGSFGFREGINFGTFGRNIVLPSTVGAQVGFAATQSNLSGASLTDTQRNQMFLTAGVFRRADLGLQGGIVFDYLNDDWYFDDLGVGQIRGELSMALSNRGSYGFWFTNSVREQTQESELFSGTVTETWETVDLYALFYRSRMIAQGNGEVRVYAGWTGDSDGLVGADSKLPLHNGWALESEFTYLIPDEEANNGGAENEAWNIGINLVWYPGSLQCNGNRYHRPLFDVANNGSMMLRRK